MTQVKGLSGLRGIAALVVALDHFVLVCANIKADSVPYDIATFFGSFGVGLFFLISGFVICLSLSNTSSLSFLWRRIWRLYPVFAFCCLFKLLVMYLVSIHSDVPLATPIPILWKILIANVSLFGGLVVPLDQMIEPIVWTLAIELKFYLLAAVVFWLTKNQSHKVYLSFLIVLALCLFADYALLNNLAGWRLDIGLAMTALPWLLCGTFTCLYYTKRISSREVLFGLACALLVFYAGPCRWFITWDKVIPSYILAAILFWGVLYKEEKFLWLGKKTMVFLGDFSYPLYGIHPAIALFIVGFVTPSIPVRLVVFLGGALTVAVAVHFLIERPSILFSKKYTPKELVMKLRLATTKKRQNSEVS